jgi:putative PIN family toxin of toxin-antitoxin system
MQVVIIDTNILVSAFINPEGPPGRIVNMLLNQDFQLAVDDRILHEYEKVLTGPKFRFDRKDVYELIHFIRVNAILVTPSPLRQTLPDAKDQAFWEVTKEVKAKALITGNLKHFPGVKEAISPAKFLTTISSE